MLSYDTQNFGEGGNTRPHAEMLKAKWDAAGVSSKIIPTPQPDNVHLVARIEGDASNDPLLLLGHSDVVPVEREQWSVDPFGGVVKGGMVYGRGALDMKGANAAFISALLRHVSEGAKFDRDIIVLTDADEEAGSYGSAWLAQNHWDEIDAGMVLTEGGWFLAQEDGRTPMMITVTRQDKQYFNIDVTAEATATHSSKPIPDAAVVKLSRALARLGEWSAPVRITPVTRRYFEALARATEDERWARAIRQMLGARNAAVRERAAKVVVSRSDYPWLHSALLRTTHSFVIAEAGYKENVIPSTATARLNCRGLPGGQTPQQFMAQLRRVAGDDVTLEFQRYEGESDEDVEARLAQPKIASSVDSPLYRAIAASARATYPEAVFAPALFEAGTSLGPWVERGVPGYGVYPYVLDGPSLVTMHGNDERIGVQALRQGTEFMYGVFDRFRR
ncbi:M20/M25/M40 family metallo-hydrolase [Vallicoccus soli]|uniref:M20/M25/M40 family metallo-hydrolase n=2 Tax=Vallicoccus soli TaxID=2339232 RepID=A0A3A3Z3B0_9ACTN|nr:M20/M25/M40 family metallo-hydrolase [Vallicoccus soli]